MYKRGGILKIMFLLPNNPELIEYSNSLSPNLKLNVAIKNGIYYDELVKVLIGVCGLQVNITSIDEKGEVNIEISGDMISDDVEHAVHMLIPHMEELFNFNAKFSNGMHGIMQIITLMELDEALKRRRLS